MGDALAIAVMTARGFRKQDFAQRHPAGAIGRALLYKVGDIMRRDQRNAVARQDQTVQDGLLTMTHAKTGSVSVVDGKGRLAGVAAHEDILQRPLKEVMTRNPITIRDDALAVDALRIFNDRNIDDLIVVNARKEPVGLVDSQDLPKLKLM
jgi:arabinose-5-phosphate isomerase